MLPSTRQHCIYRKILVNVVLILLGQHCRAENPVYCSRDSRQNCTGKSSQTASLFGNFYFGPINLLIITSCCKMSRQHCMAQISPTLHKKNPSQAKIEEKDKIVRKRLCGIRLKNFLFTLRENRQKTFVTLSGFWPSVKGGGGWVNLLKKGNSWWKSFFQIMLNEVLKICEKWYLLT